MAVLRQDLLRSSFQEKQIDLLESLDKNMSRATDASVDSAKFLEDRLLQRLDLMFNNLATSINNNSEYSTALDGLTRVFQDTSERSDRSDRTRHRESVSLWTRFIGDQQKSLNRIVNTISSFNKKIGFTLDAVIANTDQFSAFYNTTIKNTGMSGTAAQAFRSDILDIVKELNQQYRNEFGGAFNANDSLQVIATIVNSGIRNPEYYLEFGDELLEANLSMNINLATLAKFSDKFYRRYNFSSESMESVLNNINENVAATGVSEEDLIKQIEENEFVVAQWLTQKEGLTAGTAEFELRQRDINNNLNDALAYATEVGLEGTLSTIFKAIEGGQTSSEAMMILQTTGLSVEDLTEGYMTDPTQLLYTVAELMENSGIVQSYANSPYRSEWAKATGFDESIMKEVILATEMTPEEFEEMKAERVTAESIEDKVEDIYVSSEDRFANDLLDKYGDSLAQIQEDTGWSMTFLETIANTVVGILGLLTAYIGSHTLRSILGTGSGSLFGGLGNLFGAPGKGLLSSAGAIGIAIASIGTTVIGIKDIIGQGEEETAELAESLSGYSDVSLGEGESYGYGVTGTHIDENGDILADKGLVSTNNPLDHSYYDEVLDDSYTSLEKRTGMVGIGEGLSAETFFTDLGRSLVGPGYWKDDASWYDYIPLIGGLINTGAGAIEKEGWFGVMSSSEKAFYTDQFIQFLNRARSEPDLETTYLFYLNNKLIQEDDLESLGTYAYNADLLTESLKSGYVLDIRDWIDDGDTNWYPIEDLGVENPFTSEPVNKDEGEVFGYDTGTNYVPYDQLAYIHEGEAITPKQYNPAANINELERLRSQEAEIQEGTLTSLKEVASAVKAIQEFLEFWRQDSIDREAIASVKATTSSVNSNLLSLQGYGSY